MSTPSLEPLRILHVLEPAIYGGLESVVQTLAGAQKVRGHIVHVLALVDAVGAEPAILADLRSIDVSFTAQGLGRRDYRARLHAIRETVHTFRPAVVHTHGYVADVLASMISHRIGAPLVTTVHGFTGGGIRNRIYEWVQCQAFRRFGAVVAVSHPLAKLLIERGVSASNVHPIPNAWAGTHPMLGRSEARAVLRLSDDGYTVGWVGRISREKGLDILVEAMQRIEDVPVRLAVIGDGPERTLLATASSSSAIGQRIHWLGVVHGAARVMKAFDLLVISSRTEASPMTLLEAMHAGVPVIATAVGGIPDMVSKDEVMLVAPERPTELANAIRAAHDDPLAGALRAAQAEHRLRRDFSIAQWLDRYDDVYSIVRPTAWSS